jgi:ribosomal protein S18 acetylase RimI-like enzyme
MNEIIHQFDMSARGDQLAALWQRVFGYSDPHNAPQFVIAKKLAAGDGLLFVAEADGKIVGSIMAGYDGHRGWLYSLAVLPDYRKLGIGSRLVQHAEKHLKEMGCPKINLQIMNGNEQVESFYRKLGYETERRISMGKKILANIPSAETGAALDGGPATPLGNAGITRGRHR